MCVKPQPSTEEKVDDGDYISTAQKPPGEGLLGLNQISSPNSALYPNKNALNSGNSSAQNSEERSKSAASRRMSAQDTPQKDANISTFFRKSSKNEVAANSLSSRDFIPMHFKEKNGTQLVVQMSGQGLTTKRLPSARHNSNHNDSKSQGSRGSNTGRNKNRKKNNAKMSSTHSLQINMT